MQQQQHVNLQASVKMFAEGSAGADLRIRGYLRVSVNKERFWVHQKRNSCTEKLSCSFNRLA
jgi:hypothetical protein